MQNIHGPHEWVSVQDMARATELCVTLLQLWNVSKPGEAKRAGNSHSAADADLVDWAG
jgi:hypothetical protein